MIKIQVEPDKRLVIGERLIAGADLARGDRLRGALFMKQIAMHQAGNFTIKIGL